MGVAVDQQHRPVEGGGPPLELGHQRRRAAVGGVVLPDDHDGRGLDGQRPVEGAVEPGEVGAHRPAAVGAGHVEGGEHHAAPLPAGVLRHRRRLAPLGDRVQAERVAGGEEQPADLAEPPPAVGAVLPLVVARRVDEGREPVEDALHVAEPAVAAGRVAHQDVAVVHHEGQARGVGTGPDLDQVVVVARLVAGVTDEAHVERAGSGGGLDRRGQHRHQHARQTQSPLRPQAHTVKVHPQRPRSSRPWWKRSNVF